MGGYIPERHQIICSEERYKNRLYNFVGYKIYFIAI